MKVLQINSVCGIGSTGRIATDIHKMLINKGHESIIAYGRDPSKNCNYTIKIGDKIDFYNHVIFSRVFDNHGFNSKNATQNLIASVVKENPDVIHLHNIHGYYINIEILFNFLKEFNKPVVWTLHDCWSFTGHCAHFDYIGCYKWINECFLCPQKNEYPKSIVMDRSKINYLKKKKIFTGVKNLTIVTPSLWLQSLVKQSFLNSYKSIVINNGIDLEVFKHTETQFREKYSLKDKYLILGVANVWSHLKGLDFFYELAEKISENEKIVLVGLNKNQLKTVHENIIGIEKTNNINELAAIYSAADVYLNPTLEDNFPTTNLEALACGVPVISFDTGGSSESIDESTGIVLKKHNVESIIYAVEEIKNSKTNYKSKCFERAKLLYDRYDRYEEYYKLYEDILLG